jgi:DNA-binding MarR family transcriptional regulator
MPMNGDIYREVVRSLLGAALKCGACFPFTKKELTLPQFLILDRLVLADGALDQEKLVRFPETADSSGLSGVLRKMEYSKRWIKREINEKDRRRMTVRLLATGKDQWRIANAQFTPILRKRLKKLRRGQLLRLVEQLSELRDCFCNRIE